MSNCILAPVSFASSSARALRGRRLSELRELVRWRSWSKEESCQSSTCGPCTRADDADGACSLPLITNSPRSFLRLRDLDAFWVLRSTLRGVSFVSPSRENDFNDTNKQQRQCVDFPCTVHLTSDSSSSRQERPIISSKVDNHTSASTVLLSFGLLTIAVRRTIFSRFVSFRCSSSLAERKRTYASPSLEFFPSKDSPAILFKVVLKRCGAYLLRELE